MFKILSNLIAVLIILVSLFLLSFSAVMFIVTDWSRWTEAVPMFGIAFGFFLAVCSWYCLCLVPHFAAPFTITMPTCIKRWMEENNKSLCPHIHTGYEAVPIAPPQVAESSTDMKSVATNPKKLGTDSGLCTEVSLDQAVKVYGESLRLAILLGSSRIVLSRKHAKCQGKLVTLEVTMNLYPMKGKVCVEVLEDYIVPQTDNWTSGVDFRQVDRFNIILR